MLIAKILERTDEDIFESREEIDENVKNSSKFKIRKEQYAQNFCEIKTDTELFESGERLSPYITDSKAYKDRVEKFSMEFFEDNFKNSSIEEILGSVGKFPRVVLGSRLFQSLMNNVSKHERSEIFVMQSFMETLKLLSHDQSHEAKTQRKIIGASLTSLEFGVPKIGLTRREEQDAMEMKKNLCQGSHRS